MAQEREVIPGCVGGASGKRRAGFAAVLKELQLELEERGGPPELVRYRRALLRGFRAAQWCLLEKAGEADARELLRAELFTRRDLS